jgi:hypothetical protein
MEGLINLSKVVTNFKDYQEEVLINGKFCDHGTEVDYFLDESDFQYDLEDNARLINWLPLRLDYVINTLKTIKEGDIISRAVVLDEKGKNTLIDKIKNNTVMVKDIGVYWAEDGAESPHNYSGNYSDVYAITVSIPLKFNMICIDNTIKSRMDYVCGDDEKEVYLLQDTSLEGCYIKDVSFFG